MDFRRLKQVIKYGKKDADTISKMPETNLSKYSIFKDILICYFKYNLWSNQYKKEKFWQLDPVQRKEIGTKYQQKNSEREEWLRDYFENHRFLNKWKSFKYESSAKLQHRRIEAYRKRYNIGDFCHIGHDVIFERHHYLPGSMKIGNHVLLAKHVFIDYSGDVVIEDGVKVAADVIIESHHRDLEAYKNGKDVNIPTKLLVRENAYIGSRAIILDSCNYIGKNARIGAGAVVTKDIPDNAVAVGVPAKVIKIIEA
jgi:acetyltransferase-like isoleucine patch superfamily enzyme